MQISIQNQQAFRRALRALTPSAQRRVAARFIGNVIGLVDDPALQRLQRLLAQTEMAPAALAEAYPVVQAIYLRDHPRSQPGASNYKVHAAHLVTEAFMTCLPVTIDAEREQHIAETVATYCRLARLCAALPEAGEHPRLARAEQLLAEEIGAQFRLLAAFLVEEEGAG